MGHKIGYPCDVWSIGCTIFEIYTGKQLFKLRVIEELFVLIDKTLGPFTENQVKSITSHKDVRGIDFKGAEAKYVYLDGNVESVKGHFEEIEKEEKDLYEVINKMLIIDPKERIGLCEVEKFQFFIKSKQSS